MPNTNTNTDADLRFSLLDLDLPPPAPIPVQSYSLVGECAAAVAACTTDAGLRALAGTYKAAGSAFSALSDADKLSTRLAWRDRRYALTVAYPIRAVAETAPATTIVEDLTAIATASVAMAANLPARRAPRASQSAAQIATAVLTARAAGSRLAGYDGRIVDATDERGLGTVVAFGSATTEYDLTSDSMRQILVAWETVETVRIAAGLPERAFGRPPGSVGLLGKATQILNHGGYVARNVRNGSGMKSAWKIGFFDNRIDSDSLGRREALISLTDGGELVCDNPEHPGAAAVIADYTRRLAGTLLASDDLRTRIEACLVSNYGARSTDLGLYVAPYHAARAIELVTMLRPIAGRRIYAWAHTDRESIAEALVDSFAADLTRLEIAVENKSDDLRKCSGARLIERAERLRSECDGLATILGADAVASFRARILACDTAITIGLDATSARFANLELDLG